MRRIVFFICTLFSMGKFVFHFSFLKFHQTFEICIENKRESGFHYCPISFVAIKKKKKP